MIGLMRVLALAGALFSFVSTADAAIRIKYDGGGNVAEFIEKYERDARSGAQYIIDGPCLSACTLFLTILPPEKVCITERGTLGFHSATSDGAHTVEGTRLVWRFYPRSVRKMLIERGWNGGVGEAHPDFIYLEPEELDGIVQRCA